MRKQVGDGSGDLDAVIFGMRFRGEGPLHRLVSAFLVNSGGGVLVLFAIAFPVLLGLAAAGLEYGSLVKRRTELQRAADASSIAGVNQFKLVNADDEAAIKTALAMARGQAWAQLKDGRKTAASAEVLNDHSAVNVKLTEVVPLDFGRFFNMPEVAISVTSTARLAGTTRLCLLALDPSAKGAFHLESSARVTASQCSLYSNSADPAGIQAENNAIASALSTCSAGGFTGARANFTPTPATGCPALKDPLIDRVGPSAGPCIVPPPSGNPKKSKEDPDDPAAGAVVISGPITLEPGTYCGGLRLTKQANVVLRPGVYIMKDGPLVVDKKASMSGVNVGFYFTGDRGGMLFDQDSVISLTAPRDGPLAGLLLFEERSVSSPIPPPPPASLKGKAKPPPGGPRNLREYRIISDEARTMLGTIYLPVGRLIIDSKKPVADMSAYTVIVARLIDLYDGPNLTLNARYGSTDVPVPRGVGPSSADTILTQ